MAPMHRGQPVSQFDPFFSQSNMNRAPIVRYRRNILGIKPYGLAILGFALAIAVAAFFFNREPYIEFFGIVVVGVYLIFGVTEASLKRAADEYSKRLLHAAQAHAVPKKRSPETTSRRAS
jgi:hypothetical protein